MTGPVGRFLAWWGGELAALVPGPVRRAFRPRRPEMCAEVDPDVGDLALRLEGRGRAGDLGAVSDLAPRQIRRLAREIARGRLDLALVVDERRAVRQELRLPLAAEEDLAGVLAFEIDRVTPFRADEIHYAARQRARRPEQNRLVVDLVYLPRAEIAAEVARLGAVGLPAPTRLDLSDPSGARLGLDLMPGAVRRRSAGRTLSLGLAVTGAVLGAVWLGVLLADRQAEVAALRDVLGEVRRLAVAQAGTDGADAGTALAAYRAKRAAPSALAIVAAVTEALPDGTWLERLELEGGALELAGLSDNATALPGLFAADPRFERPAFAAPITRARDGQDRFLLRVTYRGEGGAE